jgi:hypothetical protein
MHSCEKSKCVLPSLVSSFCYRVFGHTHILTVRHVPPLSFTHYHWKQHAYADRDSVGIFLSGEGPRSRRYGRTAALRLLVQPCDEDNDD